MAAVYHCSGSAEELPRLTVEQKGVSTRDLNSLCMHQAANSGGCMGVHASTRVSILVYMYALVIRFAWEYKGLHGISTILVCHGDCGSAGTKP